MLRPELREQNRKDRLFVAQYYWKKIWPRKLEPINSYEAMQLMRAFGAALDTKGLEDLKQWCELELLFQAKETEIAKTNN